MSSSTTPSFLWFSPNVSSPVCGKINGLSIESSLVCATQSSEGCRLLSVVLGTEHVKIGPDARHPMKDIRFCDAALSYYQVRWALLTVGLGGESSSERARLLRARWRSISMSTMSPSGKGAARPRRR